MSLPIGPHYVIHCADDENGVCQILALNDSYFRAKNISTGDYGTWLQSRHAIQLIL